MATTRIGRVVCDVCKWRGAIKKFSDVMYINYCPCCGSENLSVKSLRILNFWKVLCR